MANVSSALKDWSNTSASNQPDGTDTPTVDDDMREIQGAIVRGLSHKGTDIASAATTDLGAVEGLMHDVTGVTTITSFGTVRAGIWKIVKFEGALTLTHNATSLILIGGASRTTANGDIGIYISEGSGNWREVAYFKAGSFPATLAGTETLTNKTINSPTIDAPQITTSVGGSAVVTQADMEAASATNKIVNPARLHFHPGVAKAWASVNSSGTLNASYGVSSTTDGGAGDMKINFTTGFSTSSYGKFATIETDTNGLFAVITASSTDQNGMRMAVRDSGATFTDPTTFNFAAFGDFA